MIQRLLTVVAAVLLAVAVVPASAAISAAEAERLGNDLTPLGGEKAGNRSGSIPAWDGGLSSAAKAGFPNHRAGAHYQDPFAADKPLYTITRANMGQYAA
ncbi:MAG: DUF1329 domain-containing protein, partial [Steroidobacteraceae bacterium]|nr:DUF1329 domain-containing protein [Steroidobacteraceae bacterium]